MKKFAIIAVIAVLLVSLLAGCQTAGVSRYNTELLNGGEESTFDYTNLTELQKEWKLTSGGTASNVFSIVNNGSNPNFLKIDTSSAGYATVSQKLYLKSYSYYKVSYTYTATTMTSYAEDVGYVGLFVGFLENPDFNISSEKATEERNSNNSGSAEFYFKTNATREVNIAINVGTEQNPVKTSNVTIKNISLVRVDKAEAIAHQDTLGLYDLTTTIFGAPTILNLVYVVLGAIGTVLFGYFIYMLRARSLALEEGSGKKSRLFDKIKNNKSLGLIIVIVSALVVRLVIMLTETFIAGGEAVKTVYFGFELTNLAEYGSWIAKSGTPYFLEYNPTAPFMPFALYIAGIAGLIGRLIGVMGGSASTVTLTVVAVIKLFAIAADIGTIILIYKAIEKRQGKVGATIMSGFYALLPVIFFVSASLGSLESITIFFAVLAFYCILEKRYIGMALSYFTACMITTTALIAVPFVLMYTAFLIYKAISERNKKWILPTATIVGGLVAFFLVTLPLTINYVAKGKVFSAFEGFIATVKGANVYTANAFNFQAMIGNNFKPVSTESTFITILFVLFVVALLAVAYFRTKNRLSLVMLASSFIFVYWIFCNNMSPNMIVLALPLLLIYASLVKDRRLFVVFTLFSALSYINSSYVYMIAGYTDAGITQLTYATPIMYIMGALNLIAMIYFIVVAYDNIVSRQAWEHLVLRVTYPQYFKSKATNIWIAVKNFGYGISSFFQDVKSALKKDKANRQEEQEPLEKAQKSQKKDKK